MDSIALGELTLRWLASSSSSRLWRHAPERIREMRLNRKSKISTFSRVISLRSPGENNRPHRDETLGPSSALSRKRDFSCQPASDDP
jgi:hypothetical protein